MSPSHFIGHVVRRGLDAAQKHCAKLSPATVERLQHDARLYESLPKELDIKPYEFLPVIITLLVTLVIMASMRYSVGDVMASLAMIESPSSTAIITTTPDDAPPAYTDDEPDATVEKAPLVPEKPAEVEADTDVEVTVINHKPITSKVTSTMGHLLRVGGWRARWRGLGLSVLYHALHGSVFHFLVSLIGASFVIHALLYIVVSVLLVRIHMLWTHSMIATSPKPWYRRLVPRQDCKPVLLPALVFAAAQVVSVALPVGVAIVLDLKSINHTSVHLAIQRHDYTPLAFSALRLLAVLATALAVTFAVLLPAAVTLTRIEAILLPADSHCIVPFDREAILGNIDVSTRRGRRALFVEAWRSFDRSARLRIIKVYLKLVLAEVIVFVISAHLILAELFAMGPERLTVFFKSASAQVMLAAMEQHQAAAAAVGN